MKSSNIFVLYDYFQVAGGAERLTLDLAEAWSGSEIVASRGYPAAKVLLDGRRRPRYLGDRSTFFFGRILEALWNFKRRTQFLKGADLVVYSGIYAPLSVVNQKKGCRIYYCHTPPRYAYDLQDVYLKMMTPLARPLLRLFSSYIRHEYASSLRRMDRIFSNSVNVQQRLLKHVGVNSTVLYPPIDIDRFRWIGDQGYFLSLGRLEERKRIDVIIAAFKLMPEQKLIVISGGSKFDELRELAADADNIHFTGWQTEVQVRRWIGNCRAAIYLPADEDFGMSPVEVMAAGKPVIGVAEGGLLETVIDGQTGVLVDSPPTRESIARAVSTVARNGNDMRLACEMRARLFSKKRFIEQIRAAAEDIS